MLEVQDEKLLGAGKAFVNNREFKKAEQCLSAFLKTNPDSVTGYFEIANLYHQMGDISRAVKAFTKLLELEPGHTDASISLSVLYNDIGQYDKARKIFEKADRRVKSGNSENIIEDVHINRKFSLKHLELADLYLTYNRFDEALFEYKKASALDSDNIDIKLKMAKILAKKGFMSKAVDELKKLKNEYPNYIPARISLGVIYFGNGNILEAQAEWQKVLSKEPNHKEALMYLNLSKNADEVKI